MEHIENLQPLDPPGELIDVNGRKVHIQRSGTGSPLVIFESGVFADSLVFGKVQPEISKITATLSYDRAGMGYSEPSTNPNRSSQVIAGELFELLDKLNVEAPLVMVGFSAGGVYLRELAHQHPEIAAGFVFIDSAHENQWGRMSWIDKLGYRVTTFKFSRYSRMTHQEILQKLEPSPYWQDRAPHTHRYYRDLARPELFRYYLDLYPIAKKDMNQGKNRLRSLGNTPITVISQAAKEPQGLMKLVANNSGDEMQAEIADLSTDSREIKVDAGHDIANEKPEIVIAAIKEMIEKIRRG